MDGKLKQAYLLVAFGVLLFASLMNFNQILNALEKIVSLIYPVVLGLIFAFVLNVPMNGFCKKISRLTEKRGKRISERRLNGISLALTLVSIVFVIALVLVILIPELVKSVKTIPVLMETKLPQIKVYLEDLHINTDYITAWFNSSEFEAIINQVTSNAGTLAGQLVDLANTTVSGIAAAGIAVVIALYVLASKSALRRHACKLIDAYVKKNIAERICHVCHLIHETYAKFLSGQCVEAMILGVLIFAAFSIFRLPYAGLTAVLTSVFTFVPYIGAFCACAISALLTLLSDPSKMVLCITVYLVVQFIENNFIYPRVVGNSVGLSPLWTLVAVLIGGKLFGLLGMIMFIPLASVICTLVKDDANRRLSQKKL